MSDSTEELEHVRMRLRQEMRDYFGGFADQFKDLADIIEALIDEKIRLALRRGVGNE